MSARRAVVAAAVLIGGLVLAREATERAASDRPTGSDAAPLLVQGAMPSEIDGLVARLDDARVETIGAWTFWRGHIAKRAVIISKTLKGGANVAAATAIAVDRFHPSAIVNEGTAGGHDPDVRVGDIVLGGESVNLGAFKTAMRPRGQGSNPLDWAPLDLLASEGSAGMDPNARRLRRFQADPALLAAAKALKSAYSRGRVVVGVIGSSDVWNSELDRIDQMHRQYGTTVEDMETASAAQVARAFKVPFLGVRMVSNNITNGGAYDGKAAEAGQEYVGAVVAAYVRALPQATR